MSPLTGTSQLENNTTYGGFAGLRLDHTHADMSRAMLEGAGFELRWALESIASAVCRLIICGWSAVLPAARFGLIFFAISPGSQSPRHNTNMAPRWAWPLLPG